MTKQPESTFKQIIKILRWMFGIPLAFLIGIETMLIIGDLVDFRKYFPNYYVDFGVHEFEFTVIFILPVFLSCLFVPRPKKYAALIAMIITTVFLGAMLYDHFIISPREGSGSSSSFFLIGSEIAILAGSSTGFAISYFVFKKRGWNREVKELESPETY